MEIRVGRSGRKHGIGVKHIRSAIIDAGRPEVIGDQLWYTETDERGVELEVIAVPDDSGRADLTVIHAMPTSWRKR